MLDIQNALITIDAMGARREICKLIIDKESDYVIGLKENQPSLIAPNSDLKTMFCGACFVQRLGRCDMKLLR